MPNVDLPLNELKNYIGISPTPIDLIEFWKESLDELREKAAEVIITSAAFDTPICECYDLNFKGIDGEKIYVKMLLPKNICNPVPAIIEFHGYGGNGGDWSKRLSYPASGIAYFSMDCRDQMGNSGKEYFRSGNLIRGLLEGPKKLYYRNLYLDAIRLLDIVFEMKNIDKKNVVTLGYSQGGAISLVSGALDPRVSKIFSIYPYLSDFKRVWDLDLGDFAYQELKDFFRWYDPQHKNEKKIFETLSYIDVKNFAKNIVGEVTMVTGLVDKVCPPSTQFAVFNNIKSKKEHIIYPDFGHENINGLEDIIYEWALNLLK
ncbi:acetylxylan esterase [Candidatus Cetobacterium colombiensis]|uniref:Acetylxylan esterase n=1 Tax=Candidatus Cetobacterium colombiensis TaxID=3073100 RepID=A0ABU4WCR5_9FUSO|nr:acetylxylan esterase [Candidatus Cetobacterium colombiensis]MDX8337317.1 acetylxylan esterase [Candidatus Cetobacterium colombiensis]